MFFSSITYSCVSGFMLVGNKHRYCQADGSWSPEMLPLCKSKHFHENSNKNVIFLSLAVSCSAPEHPINGRAIFTSATFNSLVTYECDYGYMIIGRMDHSICFIVVYLFLIVRRICQEMQHKPTMDRSISTL